MRSFRQDYLFGKNQEKALIETIKKYFADDIITNENPFSIADFRGTEYNYELKSRTNALADYPTTLLPANKIFNDKHIFLFNFTDGLYYITYEKELFDTFEKKPFRRRPRIDYIDKEALYIYIPVDKLKPCLLEPGK